MTMNEIRMAWNKYNKTKVLSVLKAGKWSDTIIEDGVTFPPQIDGVRATMKKLEEVMSFPEYLETEWNPKHRS